MPSSDLEEDLLRRFQALKPTPTAPPSGHTSSFRHVSDQQAEKAQEEDEELERIADGRPLSKMGSGEFREDSAEVEMAKRMARLRGVDLEVDEDGEQEVNEFIASISSGSARVTPNTAPHAGSGRRSTRKSDAHSLEKEARDALKASNGYVKDGPNKHHDTDEEEEHADFETEDEILLRALEEAELEAETRSRHPNTSSAEDEDEIANEKETEGDILARARALMNAQPKLPSPSAQEADEPTLSFPSLPTHVPIDEAEDPQDTEAEARMALLLGLSGPRTRPGPPRLPSPPKDSNRKPGQGWNLPGYKDDRDEDPDSWCCICNKDAEVVCLGCDGDPYCEECWTEGHVGERHRTKRYAGKGGRKAIGA